MSLPTINKKFVLPKAGGGEDTMKLVEAPMHKAGPEDVIVEVYAVSLNYRDFAMVCTPNYPSIDNVTPLSDGAGVVVSVGANVKDVQVGDRVCGIFSPGFLDGKRDGTKAPGVRPSLGSQFDGFAQEFIKLNAKDVVKIPEYLTFEEASTLPCAAVTAWAGLHAGHGLQKGDSVLTQGTGGVAVFAAQFAKSHGAEFYATSSSNEKLQRLVDLELLKSVETHGVNYKDTPEWHEEILKRTNNVGIDIVVELGGAGTVEKSVKVAAKNGELACIGILDNTSNPGLPYWDIFLKALQIKAIHIGSKADFEAMLKHMDEHKIHPVIDHEAVFTFEQIPTAIRELSLGKHFGKVVISYGKKSKVWCC